LTVTPRCGAAVTGAVLRWTTPVPAAPVLPEELLEESDCSVDTPCALDVIPEALAFGITSPPSSITTTTIIAATIVRPWFHTLSPPLQTEFGAKRPAH